MGHDGHGSCRSLIMSVVSHVGRESCRSWVKSVMGHVGHGSCRSSMSWLITNESLSFVVDESCSTVSVICC